MAKKNWEPLLVPIQGKEQLFFSKDGPSSPFTAHFTKGKSLGSGAFGETFLSTNKGVAGSPQTDDPVVAIKVQAKTQAAACKNEFAALQVFSRVDHLVRFYGAYEDAVYVYFVLEFVDGGAVRDEIRKRFDAQVAFTEKETRNVMLQYLAALKTMHDTQHAHGDAHNENVRFQGNPQPVAAAGPLKNAGALDMAEEKEVQVVLIDYGLSTALATVTADKAALEVNADLERAGHFMASMLLGVNTLTSDSSTVSTATARVLQLPLPSDFDEVQDLLDTPEFTELNVSDEAQDLLLRLVAEKERTWALVERAKTAWGRLADARLGNPQGLSAYHKGVANKNATWTPKYLRESSAGYDRRRRWAGGTEEYHEDSRRARQRRALRRQQKRRHFEQVGDATATRVHRDRYRLLCERLNLKTQLANVEKCIRRAEEVLESISLGVL